MSVKMTRERTIMPPPPIPWMERPMRSRPNACAVEQMIVPTAKKMSEDMRQGTRPKMSDREAIKGMTTAQDRR